jgi:hypothetical protein
MRIKLLLRSPFENSTGYYLIQAGFLSKEWGEAKCSRTVVEQYRVALPSVEYFIRFDAWLASYELLNIRSALSLRAAKASVHPAVR